MSITKRLLIIYLVFLLMVLFGHSAYGADLSAGKQGQEGFDQYVYIPKIPVIAGLGIPPNCHFLEQDGMLAIEVESIPAGVGWALETDIPGYLGHGYIVWRDVQHLGDPGVATISYPIRIVNPGDYYVRIRNFHNYPGRPDLENDVWVRMDGGPWVKLYSSVNDIWTWHSWFELGNGQHVDARYPNLSAGDHLFEMSARSYGFRMDRIALFKYGTDGQNESRPESPCVVP